MYVRIRKDGTVEVHADSSRDSGPPAQHNFPTKWVNRMVLSGVVTLSADMLSIGGADYKIVRKPGAYCCHCSERIGDGPARTKDEADLRRAYIGTCDVAGNDDDTGDPNNPAGYEVIDYYEGELI